MVAGLFASLVVLAAPMPAGATAADPSIVSGQEGHSWVFTNTTSVTLPAAPTEGDALYAWVCENSPNGTVAAPSGQGWAEVDNTAGLTDCRWYSRTVTAGTSATVSVTAAGSTSLGLQVYEVANAGVNGHVATNSSGSSVQSLTSETIAAPAGALVLAGFMNVSGVPGWTPTYTNGFVDDVLAGNVTIQAAHKSIATPSDVSTTMTSPNSTWKASAIFAISPRWSIDLTASSSSPTTGGAVTITASSDRDLSGSGLTLHVFDQTTGALVAACSTGTSCSASAQFTAVGSHNYRAYVAPPGSSLPLAGVQGSSGVLTVSWSNQWSVAATTSAASPATGTSVTVTATASQSVTGTGLVVSIFDETSGSLLGSCSTGAVCNQTTSSLAGGVRSYRAYIAAPGSSMPPSNAQTSAAVDVAWTNSWTVALAANDPTPIAGTAVTLTATANASITGTPFRLSIFDTTDQTLVASCSSGSVCQASASKVVPSAHTYVAFVASSGSNLPPPNVQAESDTVTVEWGVGTDPPSAWQIALAAVPPVALAGSPVTLTAAANQTVDGTGYAILIFDRSSGVLVAACTAGQSCSAQVSSSLAASRTYVAYVAAMSADFPPHDIQATSSTATATWL